MHSVSQTQQHLEAPEPQMLWKRLPGSEANLSLGRVLLKAMRKEKLVVKCGDWTPDATKQLLAGKQIDWA